MPDEVAHVDAVGGSLAVQEEDASLRPADGPREHRLRDGAAVHVDAVVELERLDGVEVVDERGPGVVVDRLAEPFEFGRDAHPVGDAVGDAGLDASRAPAVLDGPNVRRAIGPLLAEPGVEPPRARHAHLERVRGERRKVDGVLLVTGVQGHRAVPDAARTGPRRGVLRAVGGVGALAGLVAVAAAVDPRAVAVAQRVGKLLTHFQRDAVDRAGVGNAEGGRPLARGRLVPDDLHATGYARPG